jgi:hypothetical protein
VCSEEATSSSFSSLRAECSDLTCSWLSDLSSLTSSLLISLSRPDGEGTASYLLVFYGIPVRKLAAGYLRAPDREDPLFAPGV